MSKRFGRNQKRKLNQRIAELEYTVNFVRASESTLLADNCAYRAILEDTAEVLGKFFITLPVNTITTNHIWSNLNMVSLKVKHPRAMPDFDLKRDVCEKVDIVYGLAMETRVNLDPLLNQMHVRLVAAEGGQSGYYVTPEAFQHYPQEKVVEHISKSVAMHLTECKEFKKFFKRG